MPKVTRRHALKTAGASVALAAVATAAKKAQAAPAAQAGGGAPPAGPFTLPKLPYAYDALAPHIDERTMRIHHTLHHQAYITNLNTALMGNEELSKQSIEQILRNINKVPMAIRQRVINNGGGHYNHSLFWEMMAPKGGGRPMGAFGKAIDSTFQSFAAFQKSFKQAALDRFGSGWVWLVLNGNVMSIISSANQDAPIMTPGQTVLLGLDVWEHAYYLNFQNRRGDYVDAWWNVVNWPTIAQRFDRAGKK